MFSALLAIALILFFIFGKTQNKDFSAKIKQFNGPSLLETIKVAFQFMGSPSGLIQKGQEFLNRYESCFCFTSIIDTYVMTGRREDVQIVFKLTQRGHLHDFLRATMGDGLIVSSGEKWKKSRVIMESVFATKELSQNFLHIFNEHSQVLVENIKVINQGEECSLWPLILRATTRTISETTLGSPETNTLQLPKKYGGGERKAEKIMTKRAASPFLYPDFMFKLYLYWTEQTELFDVIRRPFLTAIQKRKQLSLKEKFSGKEEIHSTRKIILDVLLQNNLTDETLTDEIMTLMFAGTDTTSTAICFTLLMLAMNQDIQEKVYEEVNTVFLGDKNKPAEIADLAQLKFLEKCIKESLRKLSIVPLSERYVTHDVTLSDGRVVPAGCHLVLSMLAIHNNPEYYPNPEVWNPHNFDEDRVAQRPIYTFLPFAAGLRQCVGYKFAMMSMKVYLSQIIRNFKLTTNQTEINLEYNLIVRCKNGYHVKFEQR